MFPDLSQVRNRKGGALCPKTALLIVRVLLLYSVGIAGTRLHPHTARKGPSKSVFGLHSKLVLSYFVNIPNIFHVQ